MNLGRDREGHRDALKNLQGYLPVSQRPMSQNRVPKASWASGLT